MVSEIKRINKFTSRKAFSPSRKARQRLILERARLTRKLQLQTSRPQSLTDRVADLEVTSDYLETAVMPDSKEIVGEPVGITNSEMSQILARIDELEVAVDVLETEHEADLIKIETLTNQISCIGALSDRITSIDEDLENLEVQIDELTEAVVN